MRWPAGWSRSEWPAAWTAAETQVADAALLAPAPAAAPRLARRVSFRESKLCDIFEYEKEEEEEEPPPPMLAYKATPKTRHSPLSVFRDERIDALLASGVDKAQATKELAKQFALFKRKDKAGFDALQAKAKALNDLLPADGP